MAVQSVLGNLCRLIRHQAAIRGEQVAITFEGRETTYGQLNRRASRVANGLRAACSGPQARVALLDKNTDLFYEILFGAARARAVVVAVNWRLAPAEIAYIVNDAMAEVLFVGEEYFPIVEQLRPELRTVQQVIALSGRHAEWEGFVHWRDRQDGADPHLAISGDDVALQLYTNGTTGHPKGVQLTHDNLFVALAASHEWCPCTPEDVVLVSLAQFHVGGSFQGLLALYAGGRDVIARQPDPNEILRLIATERVTRAIFVPSVMLFMLQAPSCHETDFASLRRIVYGGSPIPLDLMREALSTFQCELAQIYGLTETTATVTVLPPEDHDPSGGLRMRSCGKPISPVALRIVDSDDADLPPGEVGEILVRSDLVMKGYWNMAEATVEAIRDSWFHTGDAGYLDDDGYLYVHDRVKDMIVSGGENIYPAEVESALFGHPTVADVGVIGVPDARWGEAVKAMVVLKPGVAASEAELIAYCRERIAHYKAPKSVAFVEALPRNPSGKILKRVLRAPFWEGHDRQVR